MKQLTFGKLIKKERKSHGYNQKRFADVVGITPRQLRKYENEEIKNPRLDIVMGMFYKLGYKMGVQERSITTNE